MSVSLRKMILRDHQAATALWKECGLSEEPEDSADDIGAFLKSQQSAGFVAEQEGKIVGVVLCGNDGRYGYIHHLAVSTSSRRSGTGRKLVEACIDHLQRRHVLILVRDNNELGKAFWDHSGFTRVEGISLHYTKDTRPESPKI